MAPVDKIKQTRRQQRKKKNKDCRNIFINVINYFQVTKAKKGQASGLSSLSIGERKANLRQTNSIVQDIVSFEPMIQSVTSKAEDLQQNAPASEISTKYESLSKQAKELYAKQKETVEQHQAFIDAGMNK